MSRIDLGKLWNAWQGDPDSKLAVKRRWLQAVHSELLTLEKFRSNERARMEAAMQLFQNRPEMLQQMPQMLSMLAGNDPDELRRLMEIFQPKVSDQGSTEDI